MNRLLASARRLGGDGQLRQLALPSIIALGIKLASAGLTYVMFIALARVMTVADFGAFSFQFNLATFLCFVAGFGLHNAILRWIPEYEAREDASLQHRVFTWSLWVTGLGCVLTLAFIALSFGAARAVGAGSDKLSLASMLLIVPLAYAELMSASLRTKEALLWSLLPKDIVWRLAVLGWCAYLWLGAQLVSAEQAVLFMAGSLGLLVSSQLIRLRALLQPAERPTGSSVMTREWRKTLAPIWLAGILISLIQYMDVVLIGLLRDSVETALYFTAARTAGLMSLLLVASNMVCVPIISRLVHRGQRSELQRILKLNVIGIAIPTGLGLIVVVVFGRQLLSIFGPGFEQAYWPLVILSLGYLLNALAGPMSYLFQISGEERVYLKIMTISYLASLIVQVGLVVTVGMIGAAIGSAFGLTMLNLWSRHVAVKKTGVDPTIFALWRSPSKASHGR